MQLPTRCAAPARASLVQIEHFSPAHFHGRAQQVAQILQRPGYVQHRRLATIYLAPLGEVLRAHLSEVGNTIFTGRHMSRLMTSCQRPWDRYLTNLACQRMMDGLLRTVFQTDKLLQGC